MEKEYENVYEELQNVLTEGFTASKENEQEQGLEEKEYKKAVLLAYVRENYGAFVVGGFVTLLVIGTFFLFVSFGVELFNLKVSYNGVLGAFYFILGIGSFLVWICSTMFDFWNFHERKLRLLMGCMVSVGVIMLRLLFLFFCQMLFPIFAVIPTGPDITPKMVFHIARLILFILSVFPVAMFLKTIQQAIYHPITRKKIVKFKLKKIIDFRKQKDSLYDMSIVRNLNTGEMHTIKEKDRFIHALANGTTGTGKTSSLFTVAIAQDLKKISEMLEKQKKEVEKLLKEKRIRMNQKVSEESFCIDDFSSLEEEDLVLKLKKKFPVAGITAMAPNASFSDEIYKLASQYNLKVNRLDPTLGENGRVKPGYRGFNPLYISPEVQGIAWINEVVRKAVLCADVLQAVYDANGQSDVYFAGVNKNVTTSVAMLVLLTYSDLHGGVQPTLENIQDIVNNFQKAKPYRDHLIKKYGKKNEIGQVIMERGRANVGIFQMVLDVVDNEILGSGADKIFEQSRGLRNLINSLLANPLIRNILCCEDSIDLDQALARNEITLVNYALELGSDSTAFGLFFLLSFIQAVYRRPGSESVRTPHFFYVDELPVLLHPKIESCFSLFRQYQVAAFVAIQSLSQMEKQESTKFLKDVLMGNCAHHFVFGRVAEGEMKLYQELAGTSLTITEMNGSTETSLTVENPTISFNQREMIKEEYNISGGDIRMLDFQEVMVLTVDQGSPVNAFLGKVSFLPKYKRIKKKQGKIAWNQYYDDCFLETEKKPSLQNSLKKEGAMDSYSDTKIDGKSKVSLRLSAGQPRENLEIVTKNKENKTHLNAKLEEEKTKEKVAVNEEIEEGVMEEDGEFLISDE